MFDQNLFANALQQKYSILQQNANTQSVVGAANAALANANAAQVAPLAQSEIGLRGKLGGYYGAQSGLAGAQTQAELERAKTIGPLAGASIGLTNAQTSATQAGVPRTEAETRGINIQNELNTPPTYSDDQFLSIGRALGVQPGNNYKRGTSRVPGKGSGMKDTVKSKLAPGEAVLNKAAADMAGRDNIDALNAAGAAQMGMGMGMPPPGMMPQSAG